MRNPFKTIDQKEADQRKADKKRIDEQVKNTIEGARHLLSSEYGIKYKNDLCISRDTMIRYLINTVNPDPVKDAFFVRCMLSKLAVVMTLLEDIQHDAQ